VCAKQWCSLRETIINHHHHHSRARRGPGTRAASLGPGPEGRTRRWPGCCWRATRPSTSRGTPGARRSAPRRRRATRRRPSCCSRRAFGTHMHPTVESGTTPLFVTTLEGHEAVARLRLDAGADKTTKIPWGTAAEFAERCSRAARPSRGGAAADLPRIHSIVRRENPRG
jgi:hypothetical protein